MQDALLPGSELAGLVCLSDVRSPAVFRGSDGQTARGRAGERSQARADDGARLEAVEDELEPDELDEWNEWNEFNELDEWNERIELNEWNKLNEFN